MNLNSILGNFVKFVRGTPTAYNNLQQKNPDTLYFITEDNASSGKLYLGNKLIGGSITGATSLSELVDVFLDNHLSVNHILVYEGNHWVNKDIRDILDISIGTMQGATKDTPDKIPNFEAEATRVIIARPNNPNAEGSATTTFTFVTLF